MHAAHLVPELALARVVTAGGPYRPGDDLSLAFTTPTVSRLVAHDAELRAKCATLERALVPETIAVVITHAATPYASGEVLTLSFVDPHVARVHECLERQGQRIVPKSSNDRVALDVPEASRVERAVQRPFETKSRETGSVGDRAAKRRTDERAGATTARNESQATSHSPQSLHASELDASRPLDGAAPQIHAGERMTLREDATFGHDAERSPEARRAPTLEASTHDDQFLRVGPSPLMHPPRNGRITVRLEWKSERLRRFVQVVDKLFTIDRLGWYRHSLAMRLLIPDEIACDDMLASVEAMRHLQALRAAAVESLGKPLLAACMPGFSISSQWLETLESSREARAIAGLREALLPYADDEEQPIETPPAEALQTIGTIARRDLLSESATSVEAFLPVLIPTTAHDAALGLRLAEYRRLLVELFAQTARAGEPVRLHQMSQPNHSLDDRLWQLVGAAAEAFGGFAHA